MPKLPMMNMVVTITTCRPAILDKNKFRTTHWYNICGQLGYDHENTKEIRGQVHGLSTEADEEGSTPVFVFEADNGNVYNAPTEIVQFIKEADDEDNDSN